MPEPTVQPGVISPIDAYTNTSSTPQGDNVTATQKGAGASASEDAVQIGGGKRIGEIDQPIRGQAGWQGLGKGPTWDQALMSNNGMTVDQPGAGVVASSGAWNAASSDTNKGHTLPLPMPSEDV